MSASATSLGNTSVVRQCAWCLLVVDGSGQYSIASARSIRSATHGICPDCKESVRAEFGATSTRRVVHYVAA